MELKVCGVGGLSGTILVLLASQAAQATPSAINWESLGCAVTCAEWQKRKVLCPCKEWDETEKVCREREEGPCFKDFCVRWERASDTCSSGTLEHNDRFEISVEANAVPSDAVEFKLTADTGVTYYKRLTVGSTWHVWRENHQSWCNWPDPVTVACTTIGEWASEILAPGGRLTFNKAMGIFAVPEDVYVLHGLKRWLKPGDRVTFRWVQE
jgi:hypothetical protein